MILRPRLSPQSEEFQENKKALEASLKKLSARKQAVRQAGRSRDPAEAPSGANPGGGTASDEPHRDEPTFSGPAARCDASGESGAQTSGGKLPVRQRIDRLKDPGTEFLEFSPLAAEDVYEVLCPGANIVTGAAQISGRECVIVANNPFSKGGAYFPLTVKKHLRAQEIALENRLPCLFLVDSAGAYLHLQAEIFPDKNHFGRLFYNQAQMSAKGVPQIAVVMGNCTAGGAYIPAMADENIIVKGRGALFLGGPPLVRAATGETVTAEELGGAEIHCRISGVCDHIASSEEEAIETARRIIARLPPAPPLRLPEQEPKPPLYPAEELAGLAPADLTKPLDMREVLARILDGSEFEEFKREFGASLLAGWGHVCGRLVGVAAGQGVLLSEGALKGAHFIDLCDQRNIPLIFLQNIMGFMVGKKYEWEGIAKHGAKMVTALSLARVPKITFLVGGSFGAGNYSLCGRAYQPRFLWSWPSARIAVMGGETAAKVLQALKKDAGSKEGQEEAAAAVRKQYERESDPFYATARLWDDGLIDPADTRKFLAMGLSLCAGAPLLPRQKGVYRM